MSGIGMLVNINILADDVNIRITRIPVSRLPVPHPYQVVAAIHICELIVEILIECLVRLSALCSPPEPAAGCLVERSPKNRNACFLQAEKLLCDTGDILINACLAFRVAAVHYLRNVKIGISCVESAPPPWRAVFLGTLFQVSCRGIPVPAECDDPAGVVEFYRTLHCIRTCAKRHTGWCGIHHVKSKYRRRFPGHIFDRTEFIAVQSTVCELS